MNIVRIGAGSNNRHTADLVGAKAANLAHMASLGLPVPPAFVLPISLCAGVVQGDAAARRSLTDGLREGIDFLETATGRVFGDRRNPLLVSVRSGAARSMPGMLDTVLDVGCTPAAVHGLVRLSGHPRFAWDCRRRFLESYGEVVLDIDKALFAEARAAVLSSDSASNEETADSATIEQLAVRYRQLIEDEGELVPDNGFEQLEEAASAVYRSWMSPRAVTYRKLQQLDGLQGTAVTVQAMVFGNGGGLSGAGVAFSRDPSTGAHDPVIDVLFEAQGEDVVSGSRTPQTESAIEQALPAVAAQLRDTLRKLEREFADVQDVEFTIEDGCLWILQTRAAKRTPLAALRIAIDLVHEKLIVPSEALKRLDGIDLAEFVHKRLVDCGKPAARAIGAAAGVAVGRAAFDSASAEGLATRGDPVILMRPDTSTADVKGFAVAAGIVTAVGGRTAHAALVARQLGKPCVVGCAGLRVNVTSRSADLDEQPLKEGDWLTI
ncbi:MAG TPA: PEP/pyruvate-binding domain-containing protein, partial [Pseudolabrys sp.]|nr:PEP/pyruvate-binding domain-containing protein [Pseudolabrys sp.]